jgi:hypothetical protein
VSATDGRLRPLYPLDQFTSSELAKFRSDLEAALALDELPALYPPREALQARLESVLAEMTERERIRHSP